MADDTSTMTPEQAAQMRQQLAAYDAEQAAAAAAARATQLKPLTDLIGSDAWTAFRAQIGPAAAACVGEGFYDQVRALDVISGNLAGQVQLPTAAPAPTAG